MTHHTPDSGNAPAMLEGFRPSYDNLCNVVSDVRGLSFALRALSLDFDPLNVNGPQADGIMTIIRLMQDKSDDLEKSLDDIWLAAGGRAI